MFFFEIPAATAALSVVLYTLFLILMNEVSRLDKNYGLAMFIILPILLTAFVWPTTSKDPVAPATWFQWVKTYSCLAGAIGGWLIVYYKQFQKKWIVAIPPIIFFINILEACIRDFELYQYAGQGLVMVSGYEVMAGPWNIINGVAGIINGLCICGFYGIIVSRGKKKDYVWPDQMWFWLIGYDLWNFAYTYNSVSDRSAYCGLALLVAPTVLALFVKKGVYAQHRVRTLAVNMMITMSWPGFYLSDFACVHSTNDPRAHMLIAVLAIIWNVAMAGYQLYIMITKKRNPFKGELYTDHASFREIYLENIDVPEGKEELALANLEKYGYAAVWDENGCYNIKTTSVDVPPSA